MKYIITHKCSYGGQKSAIVNNYANDVLTGYFRFPLHFLARVSLIINRFYCEKLPHAFVNINVVKTNQLILNSNKNTPTRILVQPTK